MTCLTNLLPDIKNSIRMTMLLSKHINDILRITITFNRTLGLLSRYSLAEHRITISVSRSPNRFINTHILAYFLIEPHLQQHNFSTSRRMEPMPDRPSDQNYSQYNAPQSANYNSRTQDQPDYRRGGNPRNAHGTRLRPVSELRKSTVISRHHTTRLKYALFSRHISRYVQVRRI
jgi:hypothetical protein